MKSTLIGMKSTLIGLKFTRKNSENVELPHKTDTSAETPDDQTHVAFKTSVVREQTRIFYKTPEKTTEKTARKKQLTRPRKMSEKTILPTPLSVAENQRIFSVKFSRFFRTITKSASLDFSTCHG